MSPMKEKDQLNYRKKKTTTTTEKLNPIDKLVKMHKSQDRKKNNKETQNMCFT